MAVVRFSQTQAQEIRDLLGRRLRADRAEQKLQRARLRRVGFRISDFEQSLTPAGFDELVARGVIIVGDSPPPVTGVSAATKADATAQDERPPTSLEPADLVTDAVRDLAGLRWSRTEASPHCPSRPGLYAIYPRDALAVWDALRLGRPPEGRPLYVGKAEDSLRTRDLLGHFDGGTGSSTLRRSFAALLRERLDLVACPRNPEEPGYFAHFGLEPESEDRLTAWMSESLALAVRAKPAADVQLVPIERAIVRAWLPPLNLTYVITPWTARVKAARQVMADHARSWAPGDPPVY